VRADIRISKSNLCVPSDAKTEAINLNTGKYGLANSPHADDADGYYLIGPGNQEGMRVFLPVLWEI
jgi:hypothetical protein